VLVADQLSVSGLYFPPVSKTAKGGPKPPQTISSLPVHTPVCSSQPDGVLSEPVFAQLFVIGLYLPPVFTLLLRRGWPQPRCRTDPWRRGDAPRHDVVYGLRIFSGGEFPLHGRNTKFVELDSYKPILSPGIYSCCFVLICGFLRRL
jgi:hypothetical protein